MAAQWTAFWWCLSSTELRLAGENPSSGFDWLYLAMVLLNAFFVELEFL
jgi:hypothetical protein